MSNDAEMPFLKHLEEFRTRLTRALIGITLASLVTLNWSSDIFTFLTAPLTKFMNQATGANVELIGTGASDAFVIKLKVGIVAGILVSMPWTFFQMWCFILPALKEQERKFAMPFVIATSVFFFIGVTFCYAVVFPFAFDFFISEYGSIGVKPALRINEYLSFVLTTLLVFGVVFEMPVLSFILARLKLLSHTWLIQQVRPAIVVIFIVAAIFSPPDVVSQLLLAAPLSVLYALCIGVTYYAREKNPAQSETAPTNPTPDFEER